MQTISYLLHLKFIHIAFHVVNTALHSKPEVPWPQTLATHTTWEITWSLTVWQTTLSLFFNTGYIIQMLMFEWLHLISITEKYYLSVLFMNSVINTGKKEKHLSWQTFEQLYFITIKLMYRITNPQTCKFSVCLRSNYDEDMITFLTLYNTSHLQDVKY